MQRIFLPILPFFKTPGNADSLPPDFAFSGMVRPRAGADWLSKCQRTVGHCKVFLQVIVFSVALSSSEQAKGQICLCINQSLSPLRGFPLSFAEILYKQLHVFLPSFSNLTSFAPSPSRLIFSHSWLLIPSPSLHFRTQPNSPLIIPFCPFSILVQNCSLVSKL